MEQTGRAEPCAGGDLREAKAFGISNTAQHDCEGNVGIAKQEHIAAVVANVAFVVARRSASKSSLCDSCLLLPVPHLGW